MMLFRERARNMLAAVVRCGAAVVRAHIAKLRDAGEETIPRDHPHGLALVLVDDVDEDYYERRINRYMAGSAFEGRVTGGKRCFTECEALGLHYLAVMVHNPSLPFKPAIVDLLRRGDGKTCDGKTAKDMPDLLRESNLIFHITSNQLQTLEVYTINPLLSSLYP
jgi:hypothetical protein